MTSIPRGRAELPNRSIPIHAIELKLTARKSESERERDRSVFLFCFSPASGIQNCADRKYEHGSFLSPSKSGGGEEEDDDATTTTTTAMMGNQNWLQ